ncbi:MAG: alpha/beta fold hydrolase [Sporichthyaceae bacterium]
MPNLVHTRVGSGPRLLLVHGIGSRKEAWDPVLVQLAAHREVLAVDLPGFGASPLPHGQGLLPRDLAQTLVEFCAEIGFDRPHVAGNSLGGWIGLEMAKLGAVASVVGISPAGLWRGDVPYYAKRQVENFRALPPLLGPALGPLSRVPPLRMALTANLLGKPWRTPRSVMLADIAALTGSAAFEPAMASIKGQRFTGGMVIDVPVTVAFGSRDVILARGCRVREELPAHTGWLTPRGWGHMPMWDDPAGVAQTILAGSDVRVSASS